jgi:DNA-binding NarL/FixJ family response regulator
MSGQQRKRTSESSPACRHGHPFPENAARDSRGWLYCRECNRVRARRPAAEPDEAAIERAAAGDPPERLTPRERQAAITRLDQRGLSSAAIAERIRCSRRTVHRARSRAAA